MCQVTSWLILGAGVVFVLLSVAGAAAKVLKEIVSKPRAPATAEGMEPLAGGSALIGAIEKLLRAMTEAPIWIAMLFAGLILVGGANYLSLAACT